MSKSRRPSCILQNGQVQRNVCVRLKQSSELCSQKRGKGVSSRSTDQTFNSSDREEYGTDDDLKFGSMMSLPAGSWVLILKESSRGRLEFWICEFEYRCTLTC